MCGITGYIGYNEATPRLLAMLQKLEYRGYDSAGIAVMSGAGILVRKMKGQLSVLESALAGETLQGLVGIGHTRWATHGEPSDLNSHPHTDLSGSIAVVHNGIIENYIKLKNFLQEQGVVFISDTDTEVVAHLLNFYYRHPGLHGGASQALFPGVHDKLLSAVLQTMAKLEGSFSLGIIARDYPDRLIAVRKDSPLVIGVGKGENFIASDVPALLPYTREVYFLNDNEAAVLYCDHIDIYNNAGQRVIRDQTHIEWDAESAEKGGYAHFMLKEINEQPKALKDTISPRLIKSGNEYEIDFNEIRLDSSFAAASKIVIAACGTAYHAGVAAKYIFEHFARISTEVDIASEYRYRGPLVDKDALFIVISQSGETADSLAAMRLAKQKGAKILAITNSVGSTLSREADLVLYTWAGPEIAVASTKAFTTQLACIYLLALSLALMRNTISKEEYTKTLNALIEIPNQVDAMLASQSLIQKFASRQFNKSKVFFIGRLADYAIALEAALKLKEISYTHSEAFAAGELKHGAIALVDKSTLVVSVCEQTQLFEKMISNIREVSSRGAETLVITEDDSGVFDSVTNECFITPKTLPVLSPLLSIIPLQLFAYYCAVQRGNNPDKPRNLAKSVTVE